MKLRIFEVTQKGNVMKNRTLLLFIICMLNARLMAQNWDNTFEIFDGNSFDTTYISPYGTAWCFYNDYHDAAVYDGSQWTTVNLTSSSSFGRINFIQSLSSTDTWLSYRDSPRNKLVRYNGPTLVASYDTSDGMDLLSFDQMSSNSADNIWVRGDEDALAHFNGTTWKSFSGYNGFNPEYSPGHKAVYAVGDSSAVVLLNKSEHYGAALYGYYEPRDAVGWSRNPSDSYYAYVDRKNRAWILSAGEATSVEGGSGSNTPFWALYDGKSWNKLSLSTSISTISETDNAVLFKNSQNPFFERYSEGRFDTVYSSGSEVVQWNDKEIVLYKNSSTKRYYAMATISGTGITDSIKLHEFEAPRTELDKSHVDVTQNVIWYIYDSTLIRYDIDEQRASYFTNTNGKLAGSWNIRNSKVMENGDFHCLGSDWYTIIPAGEVGTYIDSSTVELQSSLTPVFTRELKNSYTIMAYNRENMKYPVCNLLDTLPSYASYQSSYRKISGTPPLDADDFSIRVEFGYSTHLDTVTLEFTVNSVPMMSDSTVSSNNDKTYHYRTLQVPYDDTTTLDLDTIFFDYDGDEISYEDGSNLLKLFKAMPKDSSTRKEVFRILPSDKYGTWVLDDIRFSQKRFFEIRVEFNANSTTAITDHGMLSSNNEKSSVTVAPNPVQTTAGRANIIVSLEKPAEVSLSIFDNLGNSIDEQKHSVYMRGSHHFSWDLKNRYGNSVAGGSYQVIATVKYGDGTVKVMTTMLGIKN